MAKNGHIAIGQLGENIACGYLQNRGYRLVERNYKKKWGEIDIIVKKDNVLHFVEVKSTSVSGDFPKEGVESYQPEDHVDRNKKDRLKRVVETYLHEHNLMHVSTWTLDVVIVYINNKTQTAKVTLLKDVSMK